MSTSVIERRPPPPPIPPAAKPKIAPPFPAWCKRTVVGLEITKEKISFEEYQKVFDAADTTGKGHQWWIGDVLNAGEQAFPEGWEQVLDPSEEARRANEGRNETYEIYKQVSRRVPQSRRRARLYFGHHQTVAYLESEEEQDHWLDLAEAEKWSVDKLRRKIKRAAEGGDEDAPAADLLVLQDPAIRQLLTDFKVVVSAYDDKLTTLIKERSPDLDGARFLHRYFRATINVADRQLDRDVNTDCKVVRKAIAAQMSPDIAAIEHDMRVRHYFMSTADLKDRLDLMEGMGVIYGEEAEDQRCANARGTTVYEYKIVRKKGETDADDDDDIVW